MHASQLDGTVEGGYGWWMQIRAEDRRRLVAHKQWFREPWRGTGRWLVWRRKGPRLNGRWAESDSKQSQGRGWRLRKLHALPETRITTSHRRPTVAGSLMRRSDGSTEVGQSQAHGRPYALQTHQWQRKRTGCAVTVKVVVVY
jgi:hypothetical protein